MRRAQPLEPRRIEVLVEAVWKTTSCSPARRSREQRRERLDIVALLQLRRIVAHDVDRAAQPVEPARLVGPDERLQQTRAVLGRRRRPGSGRCRAGAPPRPAARAASAGGGSRSSPVSSSAPVAPRARRVAVAVAIPEQVEPGRRPELEQVERPSVGHRQKRRQERPRALHLVRLHLLLARPARQELGVLVERAADVVPRRLARRARGSAGRPSRRSGKSQFRSGAMRADPRVVRESATQLRVER